MNGRDAMQAAMDKMNAEIDGHIKTILDALKAFNVKPKNTFYMGQTIFVMDFKNRVDWELAKDILATELPKECVSLRPIDGKFLRLVAQF